LNKEKAVEAAKYAYGLHTAERSQLDRIRAYWKGVQPLPALIEPGTPNVVKVMQRDSRVNVLEIVVDSLVQSMFVDGFRAGNDSDDLEVWAAWQANKMDKRQSAIHRATAAYGTAYATVLPSDGKYPVIRGVSPRRMTAVYGEDPDWPIYALERCDNGLWRLWEDEKIHHLSGPKNGLEAEWQYIEEFEHGAEVTPVVRYADKEDLDLDDEVSTLDLQGLQGTRPMIGQLAPLFSIQNQIDAQTFYIQMGSHFGSFRQRYILGWVAEAEKERLKAGASELWTFEDFAKDEDGNEIKIGEFSQTDISGMIASREASIRHAAALSQTPVHELTGVNQTSVSAESLAAQEAGKDRKVDERQSNSGESHEQTLRLGAYFMGIEVPDDAQVKWRETSARSFAATVDGLGKLTQMLGIPPQELWDRVPGVTRQDAERFKAAAERGNSFTDLTDLLERQSENPGEPVLA
jgi:hypothetical protein